MQDFVSADHSHRNGAYLNRTAWRPSNIQGIQASSVGNMHFPRHARRPIFVLFYEMMSSEPGSFNRLRSRDPIDDLIMGSRRGRPLGSARPIWLNLLGHEEPAKFADASNN